MLEHFQILKHTITEMFGKCMKTGMALNTDFIIIK